jgi:hypothetical protein
MLAREYFPMMPMPPPPPTQQQHASEEERLDDDVDAAMTMTAVASQFQLQLLHSLFQIVLV